MVISGAKSIPNSLRHGTIFIDDYADKVPSGRLWYGHFRQEEHFHGLMQLLILMEKTLQELEFPGAYMQPRSFSRPGSQAVEIAAAAAERERDLSPGRLASFQIKVIFRQNASWQGSVSWLEGGQEQSFRSVLELALLLDSALEGGGDKSQSQASEL